MKKLFDYFHDEIDFKEIIKHPSRWFGYSFVWFFIIIFAFSVAFLNNLDYFQNNVTPFENPDSTKLFKDIELRLGGKIEGVSVNLIKNPTNEMLARGEEIYKTTCITCHGETGRGDGIAGKGLNPPPRDFTSQNGWKNGRTIAEIYKTLQEGIPGSGMTAYDFLSPKEKISLYYIIRKFASDFPSITDKDIAELDAKYQVTQSRNVPANIPIATAMLKINEEANPKINQSQSISRLLQDNGLNRYVIDVSSFAAFLVNAKNVDNILELILINIPRNGISTKFIYSSEKEKKDFVNKILALNIGIK